MLSYRISPALYGSPAAAIDGITAAGITLHPGPLRDGMLVVPSAARRTDGRPRFELLVPPLAAQDVSAWLLMAYEQLFHGYEAPYRLFLRTHIEPGDVFIDVGAHWGVYTADIATLGVPDLALLACEPVPGNLQVLRAMLHANGMEGQVEVIPMAIADAEGQAAMMPGNSMTWRLAATPSAPGRDGSARHPVRVATIDALLRDRPALRGRRILLKVDVEGAEWSVLQGARATLDSGRVAAIIVEYHPARGNPEQLDSMLAGLRQRGYRLARFPHHHMGGALLDFAPDDTVCNVIATHPDLQLETAYTAEYRGFAPLPPPYYHELDAAQRGRRDAILREWRATDGARWSDPRNAAPGAALRAQLAAAGVQAGDRVLDLGAGSGAQQQALPAGCTYLGIDLIQRDAATVVVDLNRALPATQSVDHVIASRVIEHLYDPSGLLRWCAAHAARLTCIHGLDRPAAWSPARAAHEAQLVSLLSDSGWRVLDAARHGDEFVCDCAPLSPGPPR